MDKTFKIFTFGCKTNQQESDYMSQELIKIGFVQKKQNEKTDFTIINSCSVTANADNEILYLVRKQKRNEPDTKIVLSGCLAQVDEKNLSSNPDIYMVLGNDEKLKIADYILDETVKSKVQNLLIKKDFQEFTLNHSSRTRATLKIQDGCDNFCSYCIVPFTRGKSRSSSLDSVLKNIQTYIDYGYKEIVLSAIHLGLWGLDFNPQMKLVDLLKEIEKLDNMPRYRLGSLDPKELDDELIDFIINSKLICNHLHVSLQSANNKILNAMNRHYTVEETIEKLNYLDSKIKDLNIGADIIVGFPDETDDDFLITYNNVQSMPIKYAHVFPYSVRQFTKAFSMPNHVDDNVKIMRAKKLRELIDTKQQEFLNSILGTTQEVLVEKASSDTKLFKGVSSNYIKFLVESDIDISNNVVHALACEIENKKIFAKVNN